MEIPVRLMTREKKTISRRFARALETYEGEAFVQRDIAEHMAQLTGRYARLPRGCRILEFGCGTGLYSRLLLEQFSPVRLLLNDLCPEAGRFCLDRLGQGEAEKDAALSSESGSTFSEKCLSFLPGDAETLDFPAGWDLITSCSTLQWMERPQEFLARCRTLLRRGGKMAASTFGPETLREIRALTGAGLAYYPLEEWRRMLERAGFRLLHAEEQDTTAVFSSPTDVLRHLKRTGVTGLPGPRKAWTAGRLQEFSREYRRQFPATGGEGEDKPVRLTYQPLYFVAEKA